MIRNYRPPRPGVNTRGRDSEWGYEMTDDHPRDWPTVKTKEPPREGAPTQRKERKPAS